MAMMCVLSLMEVMYKIGTKRAQLFGDYVVVQARDENS